MIIRKKSYNILLGHVRIWAPLWQNKVVNVTYQNTVPKEEEICRQTIWEFYSNEQIEIGWDTKIKTLTPAQHNKPDIVMFALVSWGLYIDATWKCLNLPSKLLNLQYFVFEDTTGHHGTVIPTNGIAKKLHYESSELIKCDGDFNIHLAMMEIAWLAETVLKQSLWWCFGKLGCLHHCAKVFKSMTVICKTLTFLENTTGHCWLLVNFHCQELKSWKLWISWGFFENHVNFMKLWQRLNHSFCNDWR